MTDLFKSVMLLVFSLIGCGPVSGRGSDPKRGNTAFGGPDSLLAHILETDQGGFYRAEFLSNLEQNCFNSSFSWVKIDPERLDPGSICHGATRHLSQQRS